MIDNDRFLNDQDITGIGVLILIVALFVALAIWPTEQSDKQATQDQVEGSK